MSEPAPIPPGVTTVVEKATGSSFQPLTERALLPAPASRSPEAHERGEAVPGYEILKELGRGGMGVVYQARQTKLNRVVALKMILAGGHAGPTELARFRTEAEAIARLQHPGIVAIHEVGEHEGMPFFSLEFCAGGSLDQKLAGTPLAPLEAAKLVQTLAEAMQAAHAAHVIHRDRLSSLTH
jgi:serine/threonine protein kinase